MNHIMKKKLQIIVIGMSEAQEVAKYNDLVKCNFCMGGRTCTFWTTEANYRALVYDRFLNIDGDQIEPSGISNIFIEEQ